MCCTLPHCHSITTVTPHQAVNTLTIATDIHTNTYKYSKRLVLPLIPVIISNISEVTQPASWRYVPFTLQRHLQNNTQMSLTIFIINRHSVRHVSATFRYRDVTTPRGKITVVKTSSREQNEILFFTTSIQIKMSGLQNIFMGQSGRNCRICFAEGILLNIWPNNPSRRWFWFHNFMLFSSFHVTSDNA